MYPGRARCDASCNIVTDQHNATHSVKRASLDELEAHEADDGAVIAAQHVLAYHAVAQLVFQSLRDHEIVESPETVKHSFNCIALEFLSQTITAPNVMLSRSINTQAKACT